MNLVGFTYGEHNPDSWEGWHWGGMHMWGFSHRLGIPEQYDLLEDALKNTEMMVFWSADPESTGRHLRRLREHSRRYWFKELGVKMVFIDPYFNHTAGLFADKWFAPRLGTDVAFGLAIAFTWLTEGTLRQGVRGLTHRRLRRVEGLRARQERRRPKTPEWAETESGIPAREIRALAREWGAKKTMLAAGGQRRLGRRLPLRHRQRVGAHHDRPGGHAGPGQARRQYLVHDPGRALRQPTSGSPATTRAASPATANTVSRLSPGNRLWPNGGPRKPAALHRGPDGLAPAASPRR